MELYTNETKWENTPSDNSHLFGGMPIRVEADLEATIILEATREDFKKRIDADDFLPFYRAGIDIKCNYLKDLK